MSHLYEHLTTFNDKNHVISVNNRKLTSQNSRYNWKIKSGEKLGRLRGWKEKRGDKGVGGPLPEQLLALQIVESSSNHCQSNNTVTGLHFFYVARFVCLKDASSVARSTARGKTYSRRTTKSPKS